MAAIRGLGRARTLRGRLRLGVTPSIVAGGGTLAPAQNWRMAPTAAADSAGDATLQSALVASGDKSTFPSFAIASAAVRTITLDIPAVTAPGGLAYFISTANIDLVVDRSFDGGSTWSSITYTPTVYGSSGNANKGQAVQIPAGAASKLRMAFTASGGATTVNFKLHQRPASGRADIWMMNGASLEAGITSMSLYLVWRSTFPAFDPIFFNYGVGGANPNEVKVQSDESQAEVPYAEYFLTDSGGNGITTGRPYSGQTTDPSLSGIITNVQAAGKIPLVTNITYRNYPAPNAVNGAANQENGSLPYDVNVYHPLIASVLPNEYDSTYLNARMDSYSLTLAYREELEDGIHHTEPLKVRWRALWADVFARYIYTGAWPTAYVEQMVATLEGEHTDANYRRASEVVNALSSSAGKTALFNRIAATTSAPVNTVLPTLTPTAPGVGDTMVASVGTWTGFPTPTYSYQWTADGTDISDATSSSFVVTSTQLGKVMRCRVTGTNIVGSSSATTAPSSAVISASAEDALTTALVNRMTVAPSTGQRTKIDTLMKVIKNLPLDFFVMFHMHDQQAALLDWLAGHKDFALTPTPPTFTAFSGFQCASPAAISFQRGTSTFGSNYTQDSASLGFGVKTLGTGTFTGTAATGALTYGFMNNFARINSATSGTFTWTTGRFIMSRSDATTSTIRRGQEARVSLGGASGALQTSGQYLGRAATSYSTHEYQYAFAGALTPDQELTIDNAVAAYLAP